MGQVCTGEKHVEEIPLGNVGLVSLGGSAFVCSQPAVKHFKSDEIAFDYPGGWRTYSELWASHTPDRDYMGLGVKEIGGVAAKGFARSVTIAKGQIPSRSSLEEVMDQAYQSIASQSHSTFVPVADGTTTVDGVTAYTKTYKRPWGEAWYQIQDVWLEQRGTIYVLSCKASPTSFDEARGDFDLAINSFHVLGRD